MAKQFWERQNPFYFELLSHQESPTYIQALGLTRAMLWNNLKSASRGCCSPEPWLKSKCYTLGMVFGSAVTFLRLTMQDEKVTHLNGYSFGKGKFRRWTSEYSTSEMAPYPR